jgi:hypothetical protein
MNRGHRRLAIVATVVRKRLEARGNGPMAAVYRPNSTDADWVKRLFLSPWTTLDSVCKLPTWRAPRGPRAPERRPAEDDSRWPTPVEHTEIFGRTN